MQREVSCAFRLLVLGFFSLLLCTYTVGCGGDKPNDPDDDDNGGDGADPKIEGVVRDRNGPLPGAEVEARYEGFLKGDTTNAQGKFTLNLQGYTLQKQIQLVAKKDGYVTQYDTVTIGSGEAIDDKVFTLERYIETAIVGKVEDSQGQRVSIAHVITIPTSQSVAIDAQTDTFRIELSDLTEATNYVVRVETAEGWQGEKEIRVLPNELNRADFVIAPAEAVTFFGQVTHSVTNDPLAGVEVVVRFLGGTQDRKAVSDSTGSYEAVLSASMGQKVVLTASKDWFATRTDTTRVDMNRVENGFVLTPIASPRPELKGGPVDFGLLARSDTLDLSNRGEGTLTWEVREEDKPEWVQVDPASGSVADVQGPQPILLTLLRELIPTGTTDTEVSGEIRFRFNSVDSVLSVDVSASRRSVSGYVRLADQAGSPEGEPLGAATVLLRNRASSEYVVGVEGTTDESGFFALPLVLDGDYALVARKDGYVDGIDGTVSISGGVAVSRDVALIAFPEEVDLLHNAATPFRILIDPAGQGVKAYVITKPRFQPAERVHPVVGLSGSGPETDAIGVRVGTGLMDGAFYGDNLVLTCYEDTTVSILNLTSLKVDAAIRTTVGPYGVAVSGNRAYVACEGGTEGVLDVIDLQTKQRVASVALESELDVLGSSDRFDGPGVHVSGNRAYVTNNKTSGKILAVDVNASPPQLVRPGLDAASHPRSIVTSPDGKGDRLYVLNWGSNEVTVEDPLSGSVERLEIFPPTAGDTPQALAVSPSGFYGRRLLYVAYRTVLVFYDLDAETEVGQLDLSPYSRDATAEAVSAALTPDGRGLLIGMTQSQLLYFRFTF